MNMAVTYYRVHIYPACELLINSQNNTRKTYYEDSLDKPYFPTPTSASDFAPGIYSVIYTFKDVVPKKGHEFDEMELPIAINNTDVLLNTTKSLKLICI